jgi:hypothetical protein
MRGLIGGAVCSDLTTEDGVVLLVLPVTLVLRRGEGVSRSQALEKAWNWYTTKTMKKTERKKIR